MTLKRFWPNCVTLHHKTSIFKTKISQSNIILVFSCQERKYRPKNIAVFFHSIPFTLCSNTHWSDSEKMSCLIYFSNLSLNWFFFYFKQAKKVIQWFQVQNWASRTGLNISYSTFFLLKYYIDLRVEMYCLIFMQLQFHDMT